MKTSKYPFFEYAKRATNLPASHDSAMIQYAKMFSSMISDSFYVLDIQKTGFSYVKPDHLFLCGHSVEDAMKLGYDFYAKIVDPEDFPLWMEILKAISLYLRKPEEKRDQIDSFSCTLRLLHTCSFTPRPLNMMVYQRMVPVWQDNELRYLLCSVRISTIKTSGNLRLHSKDGIKDEEYNFITKRWKQQEKIQLTERETTILMLAEQGKTMAEIAKLIYKGEYSIRNQTKALFAKLQVHSMQEAIEATCCLCASNLEISKQGIREYAIEFSMKDTQSLPTREKLQRIQQELDTGKSIRKTAKKEGVSEGFIRYWIRKRILKKR